MGLQIVSGRRAKFVLKRARIAILRPNMLYIELFEKCEIALKNSPPNLCHTLSQDSKDPPCPLRGVICEWLLAYSIALPLSRLLGV